MMRSNLSLFAVVSLLSLSASVVACGGPPEGASSPKAATPAATPAVTPAAAPKAAVVKEAGDAKIGDTTRCPVTGEEFVVDASSPKTEQDGKTYFFCCSGCKKKFEAEPAKYVKKS